MRIMLFHAKNPTVDTTLPPIKDIENNFSFVGGFDSQRSLTDALETVFRTTQNIDFNWSEHGYRSTMVGDLMVVDYAETYMVTDVGFTKL